MKIFKATLFLITIMLVGTPQHSCGQTTNETKTLTYEYATMEVSMWNINVYYKSGEIEVTKREKGEEFWMATTRKLNELSDDGWVINEFISTTAGNPIYLLQREN